MTHLNIGATFPNFTLPDHNGKMRQLSHYTQPAEVDRYLQFDDGYPVIIVFYRGFFCPRDQQQLRQLVTFQAELTVNFGNLVVVGVQPPMVQAAFRAGLNATFTFFADEEREVINEIGILDETEGEYANPARPFTFVLKPDLTIHKIYDGWFFVGRPTLEDLRHDLREIMSQAKSYPYAVWNTDAVKQIRIPQTTWAAGTPELGVNGLPVAEGVVSYFDLRTGNGTIRQNNGASIFFNFTAIPGEGYRTIHAGTKVRFEIVETPTGVTARNVQIQAE